MPATSAGMTNDSLLHDHILRFRARPVFRRPGLYRRARVGAGALRARRNRWFRLRPASCHRAGRAAAVARAHGRVEAGMEGAPRRRPPHFNRRARRYFRQRADLGDGDCLCRQRFAEHVRAGAQPDLFHLRRCLGVSARRPPYRRRHVRNRLFRLSGLPRRHHQGDAGGAQPRARQARHHPYAADVDRQGGDLRSGPRYRRAGLPRYRCRGHPYLLRGRPRAPPPLGLWLRRVPGLRPAGEGLCSIHRARVHGCRAAIEKASDRQ